MKEYANCNECPVYERWEQKDGSVRHICDHGAIWPRALIAQNKNKTVIVPDTCPIKGHNKFHHPKEAQWKST